MTTITADHHLQTALGPLTQITEIRTSDGRLMGTYTPAPAVDREEAYRRARKLFDTDELKRRAESDEPCYTFEEVMAHLNSLESK